jgi:rod shape-determining protein MreD
MERTSLIAVPFLIVFYLLFIGLLALLAQMILPVIFPVLNIVGFGSALVPLVVIYASLELGDARAPLLGAILGLLLDLTPSSHHLGTSALILSCLSTLIVSQAHKPQSHHWAFRMTYVLVGAFVFILLDYLFMLLETARWYWPLDVWSKITFASLLNLAIAPFFFYFVGLLPRRCGWKPAYELHERQYAR